MSTNNTLSTTSDLRAALAGTARMKPPEAVLGVHIDATCVRVAVIADSRVISHAKHPLPDGMDILSAKFAPVLRKILDEACAQYRNVHIWAAASFPDAHLHHVRIPMVPAARMLSAVKWAVRNELPYDEKTTILDMDIEGEVVEEGTRKIAVTAYTAPRHAVLGMQNSFRSAGRQVTGITLPFFALRNLFRSRWIIPANQTVVYMNVGFQYSRISVFSNGNVILTRGIKTGFNALLDSIREGTNEALSVAQAHDALNALEGEQAAPLPGKKADALSKGEDVLRQIQPALIRIVRQIEQTMASQIARQNTGEDRTLYLSGEICRYRRIVKFIQDNIGIGIQIINPLKTDQSASAEADTDAVLYAPAVGLALSNAARTPNALFTQEERFLVNKSDNFVRIALAVLIALAIGMAGTAFVLSRLAAGKKAEIVKVQRELDASGATIDKEALNAMTTKSREQRELMERVMHKTAAVAVLGELSRLTPSHIQLTGITLETEPPESAEMKRSNGGKAERDDVLIVKGRVRGGQESPDSAIAAYAVILEGSSIFDEVAVQQRDAKADASDGVRFAMNIVLAKRKHDSNR